MFIFSAEVLKPYFFPAPIKPIRTILQENGLLEPAAFPLTNLLHSFYLPFLIFPVSCDLLMPKQVYHFLKV